MPKVAQERSRSPRKMGLLSTCLQLFFFFTTSHDLPKEQVLFYLIKGVCICNLKQAYSLLKGFIVNLEVVKSLTSA
jgi:hypothetical protein